MAAADVDTRPHHTRLFFCHECMNEVYPKLPDYTCSQCNSGFIEELGNQNEDIRTDNNTAGGGYTEEWEHMTFELPDPGTERSRRRPPEGREGSRLRPRNTGQHIMFQIGGGPSSISMSSGGSGNTSIDSFIQQVFNNLGVQVMRPGGGPGSFNIGSSFGDYVWGQNGLDNIITQLLNQLENTGPPPAEKSKIDSIPVHITTQKDVDENAECAVCRCDYSVGEEVKRLPCTHIFHSPCLDPWLVLHDSCPICRCNLDGERPSMEA